MTLILLRPLKNEITTLTQVFLIKIQTKLNYNENEPRPKSTQKAV